MSGIQQRTKIHFIAALLAHAIADVDFNSHKGVWITSDKLASALNMHYCIHSSLCFNGNELCTATCDKYLRILNGLGLGTINSENFELNTSHVYTCSHRPNKGSRSTLFFMETFESSSVPDVVGMKRSCTESIGKSRTRRKSTEKVHDVEEEKATSPLAVASERSIRPISLRRSKRNNAPRTPANLTGPPNIYRSAQTSKILKSRRQQVVQPPSSCAIWFKSVLDVQDSLSICHEPVKIPERNTALHSLMKQAESERIGNAIKLDENKRELENERAIEAEAKKVSKVREKSLDMIFSNRRKGVPIYWYSSEARNIFKPDAPSTTCMNKH